MGVFKGLEATLILYVSLLQNQMSFFLANISLAVISFIPLLLVVYQSDRILTVPKDRSQKKSSDGLRGIPTRWIVTSRIENGIIKVPNWIVLLYDGGKHDQCRYPDCVSLGSWTPRSVLVNSSHPLTKRRLYGFLYAMSQGATFIAAVETLGPETERVLSSFIYTGTTSGLVPLGVRNCIQPETLFIQNYVNTKKDALFYKFQIDEKVSPSIQMSLSIPQTSSYIQHMDQLPAVFVPVNCTIPLYSDVMLFRHDAFWALFLDKHISQPFHFIIQKLLWLQGSSVGLFPNSNIRHSYTTDLDTGYSKILSMLEYFKCSSRYTIVQCLSTLLNQCARTGIIPHGDLNMTQLFLKEIDNIGYMLKYTQQERINPLLGLIADKSYGIIRPPSANFPENMIPEITLKKYCPNVTLNYRRKVIDDIGLIITFNKAHLYSNLPVLEAMYRPYFTHILYCGPDITSFTAYINNSTSGYFIFIDALKKRWYYMYECTVQAMKLNIGVKGFLQIGDDTLLNVWNLYNFPRERIWLHTGVRTIPVTNQGFDWGFWKSGKIKVLRLLSNMRSWLVREGSAMTKRFLETYRRNSINYSNIFVSGCDFMYVPVRLVEEFSTLSSLFTSSKIMLEIGFANMAMLMDAKENIYFAQDGSLWKRNRSRWAHVYTRQLAFLHPFKLSSFVHSTEGKHILCDEFFGA